MVEIAFVLARRQNSFFVEIVEAARDELERLGVSSSLHWDRFPAARDGLVYALVPPHEFFALTPPARRPTPDQLRRTIGICAEQPGTAFFRDDIELGRHLGALFDINASSVRAFERNGVAAQHFPLGWTPSWSRVSLDAPSPDDPERDVDVLHLGIYSVPRARALAASAPELERWRCRLTLGDDWGPNYEQRANYTMGTDKWELLARSRVLLNLHVAERPYFEWLRVVQAVANGCLVVSEHSTDFAPMVPGLHMLVGRAENLGVLAGAPLEDEDYRRRLAGEAWKLLKDELPLQASIERLVDAATRIDDGGQAGGATASPQALLDAMPVFDAPDPLAAGARTRFPSDVPDQQASMMRAALKSMRLELMATRRDLARLHLETLTGRRPRLEIDTETPIWNGATPRVSVILSLYNYERHITAALDSVAASTLFDLELIVVDDGSTDGSAHQVRRWAAEHPRVALRFVRFPVNRGLGAARNAALDFARGELIFVLDADNMVHRHDIARLVAAMDEHPGAGFAYGLLEEFTAEGPMGLRSYWPWRPERLRVGNYIDAMAMWRRRTLRDLGAYATESRLHGWEDYDLWCRAAEHDVDGLFVSEIVARYRVTRHSMLSVTDISSKEAVSVLAERYPRLMAGVEPPL